MFFNYYVTRSIIVFLAQVAAVAQALPVAARPDVRAEDLRHPQLASQYRFHLYSLISMSTPAGNCRRMSVSTVRDDGSMMSMRRLWGRISKCSRESLSTKGDLFTVNFLISVGSGIGPATDTPVRSAASTICSADWSRMRWSYAFRRILIFCRGISIRPGQTPSLAPHRWHAASPFSKRSGLVRSTPLILPARGCAPGPCLCVWLPNSLLSLVRLPDCSYALMPVMPVR